MSKFYAATNGQITVTRSTQNRTYTHAVVGKVDGHAMKDYAHSSAAKDEAERVSYDRKQFAYYSRVAALAVGSKYVNHNGYEVTLEQSQKNLYCEFLRDYGATEAEWVASHAKSRADHLARTMARYESEHGRWLLCGFAGRPDLAEKLYASARSDGHHGWIFSQVEKLDAVEITTPGARRAAKAAEKGSTGLRGYQPEAAS